MVRLVSAAVVAALALAPSNTAAQPVPPVRLSVATSGTQADGVSSAVAVSRDGRTVLFSSAATNLVAGDTNGQTDLFVRDRDTDRDGILDEPGAVATLRMNEGLLAAQTTDEPFRAQMTPNGRWVLFNTRSPLVSEDTNGVSDGYLRDRDADADGILDEPGAVTLVRVTTGTANLEPNAASRAEAMTPDGRYVLFFSASTTLHAPPVETEIGYRKDLQTGITIAATTMPTGTPPNASITSASISDDGRLVAFSDGFVGPLGPPAGSHWVVRDLVADTFVPIVPPVAEGSSSHLPATSAAQTPGAAGEPLLASFYYVSGFSPNGSRLQVSGVGVQVTGSIVQMQGSWYEYDVVAGRVIRSIRGVPDSVSAPTLSSIDPAVGFAFTSAVSSVPCTALTGRDRFFYDRRTDRIRTLVGGLAGLPVFSADGRRMLYIGSPCDAAYLWDEAYDTPLPMPAPVYPGWMDAAGTMTIFSSASASILDGGSDTNGVQDVFAVDLVSRLDRDADGLDDRWEVAMGLDYTSSAGSDGAAGDPDSDGLTNLQEQSAASHPRGTARQFLAEGADNAFFKTRLAVANPGSTPATAVVRLDGDDGSATTVNVSVPAGARRTVFVDEHPGHAPSFATVVESSAALVSERTMTWDASEYGAHAERASAAPSTSWFLAEGATGAFSLFYLLQNPGDTAATATVRYLRPSPLAPVERTYNLPAHSRVTLPVNTQAPELADTDVSASITSTLPILVERAMYRSVAGQVFAAGHASAGVTAAATSWFLAEGATGTFFDLFILLANPTTTAADVQVRYLLTDGTVLTKTYAVAAESRRTIYVDGETFPGLGQALANASLSCAITSTNAVPIVVERSMWFPGPEITPQFWTEAHNSPGTTAAATRWVLADGEAGGTRGAQTFVLIANTSSTAGRVRLTQLLDTASPSPETPATTLTVDVPANSRTTVPLSDVAGFAGKRFGVLVESIDTAPLAQLVVERAMYWNAGGQTWAAGTNLLATPVP
jgi:hypothetical protein